MTPEDFLRANQAARQVAAPATGGGEVQNFFNGAFQNQAVAGASNEGFTNFRAGEDEAARQATAARLKDQMDPGKYQRTRKEDGGFAFFDPEGKEIDIDTYAKRTGVRRTDAIKDSENPVDIQFENDWTEMNDLAQALYRNDSEVVDEFRDYYPDLFKKGNPRPEDITRQLLDRYPHMFGRGQYEKSKANLGNPVFRMGGSGTASGGGFSL
jgi:hypothetical protein